MACQRCQGFTVEERMFDPGDEHQWMVTTRCVNCGDMRESSKGQQPRQEPVPPKEPVRKTIRRQPRHRQGVSLERPS